MDAQKIKALDNLLGEDATNTILIINKEYVSSRKKVKRMKGTITTKTSNYDRYALKLMRAAFKAAETMDDGEEEIDVRSKLEYVVQEMMDILPYLGSPQLQKSLQGSIESIQIMLSTPPTTATKSHEVDHTLGWLNDFVEPPSTIRRKQTTQRREAEDRDIAPRHDSDWSGDWITSGTGIDIHDRLW